VRVNKCFQEKHAKYQLGYIRETTEMQKNKDHQLLYAGHQNAHPTNLRWLMATILKKTSIKLLSNLSNGLTNLHIMA